MWIFDATPLVYLAKADRLRPLGAPDGPRLVPRRVYGEVVSDGLEHEYPDARRIDACVDDGLFDVRTVGDGDPFDRFASIDALSAADAAVLSLAARRNGTAVMDERTGRDVARTEGIETRGTAYVVLALVRDGHLSPAAARETVDAMIDEGWYCSTPLYAKLLERLETLE